MRHWGLDERRACLCRPSFEFMFACRIQSLIADANKRLSYLRIVTPRLPGDEESAGVNRFALGKDGTLVSSELSHESTGASHGGVRGLDPADIKRHQASLRRFQFMDRGGR